MAWFYLVIAGIFEVVWATLMKLSEGFSPPRVFRINGSGDDCQFCISCQSNTPASLKHRLSRLDRNRRGGSRHYRCGFIW